MTVAVNQELSSIKFFFFIKPDLASFSRATQVANCFWGGRNSPIFPFYEKFDRHFKMVFSAYEERSFYRNLINNFNPDVIIVEDGLSVDLISNLIDGRIVLLLNDVEQGISKLENGYGLTIMEIMYEVITTKLEYKRNDDLHIHLVSNSGNDPLISILYNTPTESYVRLLNDNLKLRDFYKTSAGTVKDFHTIRTSNAFTFTQLNLFKLTKQRSFGDHYKFVFIFNPSDLYSLVILWNLKAAGRPVFAIPIGLYENGDVNLGLIDFYHDVKENEFGPSVFCGPYVSVVQMNQAFQFITKVVRSKYPKVMITQQPWIPRFGSDGHVARTDGVVSSTFIYEAGYEQVKTDEGYLRYELLKTNFKTAQNTHRKTHKVTSFIKYFDHFLNHPSVIDGIDNEDWVRITDSMFFSEVRITGGGIVRLCAGDRSDMDFKVPETSQYLDPFFKKNGFQFSVPPHGELTKQIFKNIGGIYGIRRFSSVGSVKVLEALENESILLYENLIGLIKRHKPLNYENRPKDFVEILLKNNIIELGALVQCTICAQKSFFPLPELSSILVCKNCRSSFSPPENDPRENFKWAYRGIGPFSRSNKIDGLLSGFLTLSLFHHGIHATTDEITGFMNFQLNGKGKSLEVDLLVQLRTDTFAEDRTDLIFAECKTYKNFDQVDIDRMKFLGDNFPGAILVFSSLKEALTIDEVQLISGLVQSFRKGHGQRPLNPVLVLTANELLPEDFTDAFKHFGEIHPSIRFGDLLGYLCEKSCEKYLGLKTWGQIKSEDWSAEQNRRRLLGELVSAVAKYKAGS